MPVYDMVTNRWVMDDGYPKPPPYYNPSDESSEEEIDYGSDTESDTDEDTTPENYRLIQEMLNDLFGYSDEETDEEMYDYTDDDEPSDINITEFVKGIMEIIKRNN